MPCMVVGTRARRCSIFYASCTTTRLSSSASYRWKSQVPSSRNNPSTPLGKESPPPRNTPPRTQKKTPPNRDKMGDGSVCCGSYSDRRFQNTQGRVFGVCIRQLVCTRQGLLELLGHLLQDVENFIVLELGSSCALRPWMIKLVV